MSDGCVIEKEALLHEQKTSRRRRGRRVTALIRGIVLRLRIITELKLSETPIKSRMPFQNWRQQKLSKKGTEEDDGWKEDSPFKLPEPQAKSSPINPLKLKVDDFDRSSLVTMKLASLAEMEDIDFEEPQPQEPKTSAANSSKPATVSLNLGLCNN